MLHETEEENNDNQNDNPVILLTSRKTKLSFEIVVKKERDVDTLLQQICHDEDYELEFSDIGMNDNFNNLIQLLSASNNYYCSCRTKEYSQTQTICANSQCKKPLSRVKKLSFASCYSLPLLQNPQNVNMIIGYDNVEELKVFFVGFPKEIITEFSNLQQLKRIYLYNCILSTDTINSFAELNNLEELVIERTFLKKDDELIHFFEILKKRKTKLRTLHFRYPTIDDSRHESTRFFYETLTKYLNENSIAEKVFLMDRFVDLFQAWHDDNLYGENKYIFGKVLMTKTYFDYVQINNYRKQFSFIDFLNEIKQTKSLNQIVIVRDEPKTITEIIFDKKNLMHQWVYDNIDAFFTENKSLHSFVLKHNDSNQIENLLSEKIMKRNKELPVRALLIDNCIALSSLQLPAYVLLWIFDWLPDCLDDNMSHHKKIGLIIKMVEFYKNKINKKRNH